MASPSPTPVHVLSAHAGFACGRSGACCASGWDIPIDPARRQSIGDAMDAGRLAHPRADDGTPAVWHVEAPGLPSPDAAVLTRQPSGDCVFLRRAPATACALQTAGGHEALPLACRQFPRVSLADDRGVHVTLSHYCPTAAASLWRDANAPLAVWENPPGWSAEALSPGLDARGHWPPLLRPGILLSLEDWTRWERFCVATFARADVRPVQALAAISAAAEALRRWTPSSGALAAHVRDVLTAAARARLPSAIGLDATHALLDWRTAWTAVPPGRARAGAPPRAEAVAAAVSLLDAERVPVGAYLAAKCVASWLAYQGHGLRAFVASVRAALSVVVVEWARGEEPDPRARVKEAVRRADLLLVHLAEPCRLAEAWSREEAGAAAAFATNPDFGNPE